MESLFFEVFQGITLIKMVVAMGVVLGLTTVAERVSPNLAGILSGFPLGAALALFFFAVEMSPEFAAHSAVYSILGLVATQLFVVGYYAVLTRLTDRVRWLVIILAITAGLIVYFASAAAMRGIPGQLAIIVPVSLVATYLFDRMMRSAASCRIQVRVRLTWTVIVIRAALSASMVVAITIAAKVIGQRWAGLFSAFPVTLAPLVLMIHASYGADAVCGILKNVPRGLLSVTIYCLVVVWTYPTIGILWGTLAAYAAAAAYQVFIIYRRRRD